jgi:ABC-type branched-subunit amino acid transport system substrate-binding protein/predicted negative regulator of RcsB-dependent stress response
MTRLRRPLLALIPLAAVLLACAGARERLSIAAPAEEREAYAAAVAPLGRDPAGAERRLSEFLERYPDSSLADDAGLDLGRIALARGDQATALRRFRAVVDRHPDASGSDSARVELAQLEVASGRPEAAAAELGRTRIAKLPPDERKIAYRVLAEVASDPVASLRWRARLRAEQTDAEEIARIDADLDRALATFSAADLDRAAEQLGDQIPAARALVRRAELALAQGDSEAARRAWESARRRTLTQSDAVRVAAVGDRIARSEHGLFDTADLPTFERAAQSPSPDTSAAEGTIGVVLPLSGPFARFGEESLQGIALAANLFSGSSPSGFRGGVKLRIRDTAGRPELAAEAVRELAADPEVSAILGPLLSGECEAAAAAAEAAGVPLLALSTREEIAEGRTFVFRLRTTPREEIAALVDHTVRDLGALRYAILYPRDRYGRGAHMLFWEAVEQAGGRVVAVAAYDPTANDFADPIRQLLGYAMLSSAEESVLAQRAAIERRARRLPPQAAAKLREEARALTGPGGTPLPPVVDFDVLFIPESYEKVVLIAPQLAFHEAFGMRLAGTSGWYHPDLLELGRRHVEGARFSALFFPESPLPNAQEFARRYELTYSSAPGAFGAQGYDAAQLVLLQLAQGNRSRGAVRDGVVAVRGFPGASGVLSMRVDGNARKRPILLGIENGRLVQVN